MRLRLRHQKVKIANVNKIESKIQAAKMCDQNLTFELHKPNTYTSKKGR